MVRQIRKKVRRVQWRLHWIALCHHALAGLTAAGAGLAFYVVLARLFPTLIDPLIVAPWVGGAAALWVIGWTWRRRVRPLEAAVRADEALGLKERLSTALTIGEARSEAEAAVLEDAARHAQEICVTGAFPMGLGRPLRRGAGAVGALLLLWFYMPQLDLPARAGQKKQGPPPVALAARQETAKQLEDLAKELGQGEKTETPLIAQKLDRDLNELARQIREKKLSGEQAAAKMEKLGEKIAARRQEIEKMLDKAATMQSRGEGRQTSVLARALQQGDFAKAAKALEELKKKMQSGKLSEEEKRALARELKQVAERMGQGAQQKKDAQQGQDGQQGKQGQQGKENGNREQGDNNSPSRLGSQRGMESPLAEALRQAAEKIEQGELNGAQGELEQAAGEMQNMDALLDEMKALEGLEHDLEGRERAMTGAPVPYEFGGEGDEGMDGEGEDGQGGGRGPWREGDERDSGNGMGGPGIGRGSVAESKDGKTAFEKKRLPGDISPGQIIARMKVAGRQPPGEIRTQFEQLRVESSQAAEDTIKGEPLPLEHKALVRKYFDAIKGGDEGAAAGGGASTGAANGAGSGTTNNAATNQATPAAKP